MYTNYVINRQAKANRQMRLFDLLFPQPSPNRCKKVTKNKIKTIMVMVNFIQHVLCQLKVNDYEQSTRNWTWE